MDDDRYGYAREKLWQAIESLVGHGSVQDRLTDAADFLLRVQSDKQLPPEHLGRIRANQGSANHHSAFIGHRTST
jgi:hypothetical protein